MLSAYLGDHYHVRGPILVANSLVALIGSFNHLSFYPLPPPHHYLYPPPPLTPSRSPHNGLRLDAIRALLRCLPRNRRHKRQHPNRTRLPSQQRARAMEARPLLGYVRRFRGNGRDQRGNDIQVPGRAEVSAWYWGSYCVSLIVFLDFFPRLSEAEHREGEEKRGE